jgi:hypothetical protein
VHLVYFQGTAAAGDLLYVRRDSKGNGFSRPIQVNSQSKSAIATGTVRGAQLVTGRNGTVHVVWNGSGATKENKGLFYARLDDDQTAFEGQRDLMRGTSELDGGGTITADHEGNVYVAWHAVPTGESGEANRRVWIARSTDNGKTISKPQVAWSKAKGICGCCSMRAFADDKGALQMIFRSAEGGGENRDIFLLTSPDHGTNFNGALVDRWKIAACPMSTMAMAQGPAGVVAVWDTDGQVYYSTISSGNSRFSKPLSPPGRGPTRKHPTLAFNDRGEMLLAWTEGTGWQKGGDLVWQVFDKTGKPTEEKGRQNGGIPVWGLPTAVVTSGGFTIIH